ncbi:hemerythrin domain-containing protein [Sphingopyxis sp.]|uniref:hemerythrin domain-containing protein n=1 Tax=Sphingopyxis sp. TaxID=1908224 RepID=UPI002ED7ADEB
MPLNREMQRLRAEHAALVTLSRIVLDMTQSPDPAPSAALASARGLLRETLVRHLKCEDWALYPRLRAADDPELVRITREFEREMGDLAADFVAYDDRWTSESVAAGWPDFCRETRIIFDMLALRIEREERELYPLADNLHASVAAAIRDRSTISG